MIRVARIHWGLGTALAAMVALPGGGIALGISGGALLGAVWLFQKPRGIA